jgi:hypothetical protein
MKEILPMQFLNFITLLYGMFDTEATSGPYDLRCGDMHQSHHCDGEIWKL